MGCGEGNFCLGNIQVQQALRQQSVVFAKNASQHTQKSLTFIRPDPQYEKYIITCYNSSDDTALTCKVFNIRKTNFYGTATAGAADTITLNATSDGNNDFYNSATIEIISGTGVGQIRTISDYVGATKVADVSVNWEITPDATSHYKITFEHDSYITTVSFAANAAVTGTTIDKRESAPLPNLFNNSSNVKLVISNDTAVPDNDTDAFEPVFEIVGNI